jgi:hypothetical protein
MYDNTVSPNVGSVRQAAAELAAAQRSARVNTSPYAALAGDLETERKAAADPRPVLMAEAPGAFSRRPTTPRPLWLDRGPGAAAAPVTEAPTPADARARAAAWRAELQRRAELVPHVGIPPTPDFWGRKLGSPAPARVQLPDWD